MASTVEEKRNLVKRYLREDQYRYVDDIVGYLDRLETHDNFHRKWFTTYATITKRELYSDPCVAPIDVLADLVQKYKELGYTSDVNISLEGITLTGDFLETEEQFEERIKYKVKAWLSTNEKNEGQIRSEIAEHEKAIQHLRTLLTDIQD